LKRRGARWLGVMLAGSIPCLGGVSFAQVEPPHGVTSDDVGAPVRLLVLGSVPEFIARVRGQVSDLDVLIEIDAWRTRTPRADPGEALIELAARHDADVIAWLREVSDNASASSAGAEAVSGRSAHAVHVWVAARRQVYSRRIGPLHRSGPSSSEPAGVNHPGALDTREPRVTSSEQSATLEAAALIVRSAVRSVLLEQSGRGGSVGDASMAIEASTASSESALPPAAITVPGSVEDREGSGSASPEGAAAALRWAPHARLDWTYAGLSRSGSWSLGMGLALRYQRLSLGVGGSYGFPEIVQHANVQLELRRQTLFAEVGWEALSLPRFTLLPMLQAGVARFARSSSTSAPDRLAKPAESSISALASLELVAEYELTGALRLSGVAGVDFLSHVPRYLLDGAGAQQIAPLEAWRFQPNAGIALGAVF
jgi:hypothetical protein